jgi:hypothetical protein
MHRLPLGCLVLALAQPVASWCAPADDIKALLGKGDAKAAYTLAKKHPSELGKPSFDFYFGVAAIDSGHAGEGVLALERYIVNFPDNREARLELARGYFVLGEDQRAREEFSGVLKSQPPATVVANIDRYLDAIRAREGSYRTTAGAFVEFGLGYDSNINGGVSTANVALPNFGVVTLNTAGVKIDRKFAQMTAGANVSIPISPGIAAFASVSGDLKSHDGNREYDQTQTNAAAGFSLIQDKNLFRGTAGYSGLGVDYLNYREMASLTGEWIRQLDEFQAFSTSLHYATLTYAGSNQIRNSALKGIGLGYRLALIGEWRPLLTVSGGYSMEDNQRGRDDLARDIYSLRLGVGLSPAARWSFNSGVGLQHSAYASRDPLLSTTRRDDYYAIDAAAIYAWSRNLSVRGELLLSKNHSNLQLYSYRRDVIGLKVRYEFK